METHAFLQAEQSRNSALSKSLITLSNEHEIERLQWLTDFQTREKALIQEIASCKERLGILNEIKEENQRLREKLETLQKVNGNLNFGSSDEKENWSGIAGESRCLELVRTCSGLREANKTLQEELDRCREQYKCEIQHAQNDISGLRTILEITQSDKFSLESELSFFREKSSSHISHLESQLHQLTSETDHYPAQIPSKPSKLPLFLRSKSTKK